MNLILEEIKQGNQKVFKNFFDEHYHELVMHAHSFLWDMQASEDIVQEVFIYVWENASKLTIQTSFRAYLFVMVRNRCINFLKSIKISKSEAIADIHASILAENPMPEEIEVTAEESYADVLEVMNTLPNKMQEVVILKFVKNYKYAEIADELGISVNTVKTQLKRAKVRILEGVKLFMFFF